MLMFRDDCNVDDDNDDIGSEIDVSILRDGELKEKEEGYAEELNDWIESDTVKT